MDNDFPLALLSRPKRFLVLAGLLIGVLVGLLLALIFIAYGQPELLLEQLNLRYCG